MEIINEKSGLSDDIEFHLFDIQPRPADSNVEISSKFSFQERMFAVCVLQMLECFDPKTKKVQFQQPFRGGLVKVLIGGLVKVLIEISPGKRVRMYPFSQSDPLYKMGTNARCELRI